MRAPMTTTIDDVLMDLQQHLLPGQAEGRPDLAATLRTLTDRLTTIRADLAALSHPPQDFTLSRLFDELAETFRTATVDGMTLTAADAGGLYTCLREAAAWAYCHEMADRVRGDTPTPEDIHTLRLARVLARQGVRAGAPSPEPPSCA